MQNLKFDRQFFRDVWRLLKPYWVSKEKGSAFLLLGLIIFCIVVQIRISVIFNFLQRDIFNALQNFNKSLLLQLIGKYIILLIAAILVFGYNVYFNGILVIRWRRWLTQQYLNEWLAKHTHYRMQVLNKTVDNPDQRISEDLEAFPSTALSLFSSLLSSLLMLFAFSLILWNLSGNLTIPLGGRHTITIPGYLLWAGLLYACLGTWLNAKIGRRLSNLNYLQQRYNADFRFGMARLREVSEQVAMYNGETAEGNKFTRIFKNVFDNFVNIIKVQKRLSFFQNGYASVTYVFGILIAVPLFFAKKIQIGGVVQIGSALNNVVESLSIFISLFTTLAAWRSVVFRLIEFSGSMKEAQDIATTTKIQIISQDDNYLKVNNLNLLLPDGSVLLENIQLLVQPKERVLLTGASGTGKSTLLRALAGIWPYGSGVIQMPNNQKTLFLPQKPYLPLGTLREALWYPIDKPDNDTEKLLEVLTYCGLEKFHAELDTVRNWSQELSLGEQQLIAFARVLLQKPDWIFLDEASSALDENNERKIYEKLQSFLPNVTILSVGHRSSLSQMHTRRIEIVRSHDSHNK